MKLTFLGLCLLVVTACAVSTCPPGNYTYGEDCKPCLKGTFQNKPDKPYCVPCQGDTVATEEGSTKCKGCKGEFMVASEFKHECVCAKGALEEGKNKCVPCEPGTFVFEYEELNVVYLSCEPCRPGYFQPEAGKIDCLPCPEGTISRFKATECIPCAEDEFVNGSGKCPSCPPGTGLVQLFQFRGNQCKRCDPNEFKATTRGTPCSLCPPGSFSNRGATNCTRCPKGQALMESGECGKCPAGTRYNERSKKCLACFKGTFMPHRNIRPECFSCAGNASSMKGAKTCVSCPQNENPMKNGTCAKCPVGTAYNPTNFSCKRCFRNTFSDGSSRYFCNSCNDGAYSLPGSGTCFLCPIGEAPLRKTGKCGKCPAGFYYEVYRSQCKKCYARSFLPKPSIEEGCRSCSRGFKSNKNRTACIPRDSS